MNSACPINLIRTKASHFAGKANTEWGREKWGKGHWQFWCARI